MKPSKRHVSFLYFLKIFYTFYSFDALYTVASFINVRKSLAFDDKLKLLKVWTLPDLLESLDSPCVHGNHPHPETDIKSFENNAIPCPKGRTIWFLRGRRLEDSLQARFFLSRQTNKSFFSSKSVT